MPSRGIIMAIYDRGGGQCREGPTCRNSDSHVGAGGGRMLERGTLPGQAGTSTGPKTVSRSIWMWVGRYFKEGYAPVDSWDQ
ncbi:hypothetical protein F2Q69_00011241 [Brassica cretica]|uniref:Uncharacterized protein n=1 Tax=Brassica cretica TaxID=69181 RepID=A0A8S9QY05_BRACR|nr:hypothetical protein F2Q69_00011241 [Brassica cretica]